MPLSFLSYEAAALLCLLFECACLLITSFYFISGRLRFATLSALAALAWWPIWFELG